MSNDIPAANELAQQVFDSASEELEMYAQLFAETDE